MLAQQRGPDDLLANRALGHDRGEPHAPGQALLAAHPQLQVPVDVPDPQVRHRRGDIIRRVCDPEDIEGALREAEHTSARARSARAHLLSALRDSDGLVAGVGNAWDALTFHWDTPTPVPR